MKLNAKLNTPQIIFTSAFVATILTVVDSFVDWDKSIYRGLFAGIMTIVGAVFAKIIFKDEN
ncbi:hypothetical protein F7984_14675 [Pradoshia sp. D12]|uniref:hypothetical protein n=1 Tax=Pradoshia sp. D12 TaxID=2651284 RepID=UPI00124BF2EF|nr:hypothetical protein [Pradoshia sp. D12]QFK72397.1 hypothetical protein F7984_14675 [Pradoshia sp. D12]